MAETDWHRDLMVESIQTLQTRFAARPDVYISGNLLIFYERGNKRKHLAPDVFVVFGVPNHSRPNYLVWEENKGPDVAIELTSPSTRSEDLKKKFKLYQDVLKVSEYYLFDPRAEYLDPPLRGFVLQRGKYVEMKMLKGRLPSKALGLHLERAGRQLRFYDPKRDDWLPTPQEELESLRKQLAEKNYSSRRRGS